MHAHVVEQVARARGFAQLIGGRKPRLRRKQPLPRQLAPDHIRLEYFGALRGFVRLAKQLVDQRLVPRLRDIVAAAERARKSVDHLDEEKDRPAEVNAIIEEISRELQGRMSRQSLEQLARRVASTTSNFQREQLLKQIRAALGVEVPIRDGALGAKVDHFTARNVSLIRSIPQRYLSQVESKVLDGVEKGRRWEDIAGDLEERFEVAESTAQLIARDQVGKFYGSLNKSRQTELGIDSFRWRDSGDNRVREAHRHLNGKLYDWNDPPDEETGAPAGDDGVIPGEPVNCRCYAEPDMSAVLDQL